MMESTFSNKNIVYILSKWWKHLLVITLLGIIVSTAATFLITPQYKSIAVVYPENLGAFSEETYTEQMVQILNSRDIADSVIGNLQLDKHWKISEDDKYYTTKKFEYYYDYITIRKTRFESVEISAFDTNPEMACQIVTKILKYYNDKVTSIHRKKIEELAKLLKQQIEAIERRAEESKQKMSAIVESSGNKEFYKLINLTKGVGTMNVKLQEDASTILKKSSKDKKLQFKTHNPDTDSDILRDFGSEFLHHYRIYREEVSELSALKVELEQRIVESRKEISYYASVSTPFVPDKKATPTRGVFAVIGGLSVFVVSFIVLSIIERKSFSNI